MQLKTNVGAKCGKKVSQGLFQSSQGPVGLSEGQEMRQGLPARRVRVLPTELGFTVPHVKPKEAAAGKNLAAPEGLSWTRSLGWGWAQGRRSRWGRVQGLGWLRTSGCKKASKPADLNEKEESFRPSWERGSSGNIHFNHLSH